MKIEKMYSSRRALVSATALLTLTTVLFSIGCEGQLPDGETIDGVAQELAPSSNPPGGLGVSQVPQFVSVSFDDNFAAAGVTWATNYFENKVNPAGSGNSLTFDGSAVRTTFYHNASYIYNEVSWKAAKNAGHEVADHTINHSNGLNFTASEWTNSLGRAQLASGLGVSTSSITGFRAPYLAYNDALYTSLQSQSPAFVYDTSIQNCWGASENGGTCNWPYTLDGGSPDAANLVAKFGTNSARAVNAHAGFWEVPVTTLIVPPDSVAAQYGFSTGLRARVQTALSGQVAPSFYEQSTGKVAGLDVTLIVDGKMTKAEALATLKYTLDLHLAGNRSPFVFVAHTHAYVDGYGAPNVPATADRRAILEEFVNYALAKPEVRFRPVKDIVAWMNAPVALGACTPSCSGKQCGSDGCGGSCGTCSGGATCNASNQCVTSCTPSCSGKQCGSDGCGGVCGTCTGGTSCNASNQCVAGTCTAPAWNASSNYSTGAKASYSGMEYEAAFWNNNQRPDLNNGPTGSGKPWKPGVPCGGSCTPSCSGKQCGSDGCGGSCGTCSGGATCNASNQCVSTCTPSCSGKQCGSDGCGGSCGTCSGGATCDASNQCTGGGGNCGGLSTWVSGASYAAGARVKGGTSIYECKPWPYSGWCGMTAYQPGVGSAWQDAWTLVGPCN